MTNTDAALVMKALALILGHTMRCSNPEEQELFYALIDRSAALQCEQEKNLPRANDALGPVKSMG